MRPRQVLVKNYLLPQVRGMKPAKTGHEGRGGLHACNYAIKIVLQDKNWKREDADHMASEAERLEFGRLLRAARERAGYSLAELSSQLRVQCSVSVSPQVLSNWERGVNAPPDRMKVQAVDELLGAGGTLLTALGYSPDGARVIDIEEVNRLRSEVEDLRKVVARLARLIDPPEPAPPGP